MHVLTTHTQRARTFGGVNDHHDVLARLDAVLVLRQLHADLLELLALLLRPVESRRLGRTPQPLLHNMRQYSKFQCVAETQLESCNGASISNTTSVVLLLHVISVTRVAQLKTRNKPVTSHNHPVTCA